MIRGGRSGGPSRLAIAAGILAIAAMVASAVSLGAGGRGFLFVFVGPPVSWAVDWLTRGALRRAPDGRVSPARFWLPRLALALLVTAALLAPLAWWALRR